MDNPSLISYEREYYVIKGKYWGLGSGEIYDEHGEVIGKMQRKIMSLRSVITVTEVDGRPLFTVSKKLVSLRTSYDIKDNNDRLLGRTKKKVFSFLRPKMWMEEESGRLLLNANGSYAGWNFTIIDRPGALIAEVKKADALRDVFLKGILDFSDTYVLKIIDPSFDKRRLLGLVLAIDSSVHQQKRRSHR